MDKSKFIKIEYASVLQRSWEENIYDIDNSLIEGKTSNDRIEYINIDEITRISEIFKVRDIHSRKYIYYFFILVRDGSCFFVITKNKYTYIFVDHLINVIDNRLNKKGTK